MTDRGRELEQVLKLAEQFPASHLSSIAASFLDAVKERGWPTITVSFSDGAAEGGGDELPERAAAVGFALPDPPPDDWDTDGDDGPHCHRPSPH